MGTIRLSQVLRANKELREFQTEAKREREFQQRMGEKLMRFAIDNYPSFVEELSNLDEYRQDERS